jgi:hypothetical protein
MSEENEQFFSEVVEEAKRMLKPYPQLEEDIKKAIEKPMFITPFDIAVLTKKQDEWCNKCGECCRQSTPIRMLSLEAKTIAHFLGISYKKFKQKYRLVPRGDGTFDMPGRPCPFLKGNLCSIYKVRPIVCRYFPAGDAISDMADKKSAIELPRYCHVIKKFVALKVVAEVARMNIEREDPTFFERMKAHAGSATPKFKTPQEALRFAFEALDYISKNVGESEQ